MTAPVFCRERRKFPRRSIEAPVRLTLENGTQVDALLRDLSATGSRISNISLPQTVTPKVSRAKLSINIPTLSILAELPSRIEWSRGQECGLSFDQDKSIPVGKLAEYVLDAPNDIPAVSKEIANYRNEKDFFLQEMAADSFLKKLLGEKVSPAEPGYKFVATYARLEIHQLPVFSSSIIVKTHAENIYKTSFDLIFSFYDKTSTHLLADGVQRISYFDPLNKEAEIPEFLKKALQPYMVLNNAFADLLSNDGISVAADLVLDKIAGLAVAESAEEFVAEAEKFAKDLFKAPQVQLRIFNTAIDNAGSLENTPFIPAAAGGMLLPLFHKNRLVGQLQLGPKSNNQGFSKKEISRLMHFCACLALLCFERNGK